MGRNSLSSNEKRFGLGPDVDEEPVAEDGAGDEPVAEDAARWSERHREEMFWLVGGGFGFVLVVGTGISQLLDGLAAFVIAGAIWVVLAWRILAWMRRPAEQIAQMQRDLESEDPDR